MIALRTKPGSPEAPSQTVRVGGSWMLVPGTTGWCWAVDSELVWEHRRQDAALFGTSYLEAVGFRDHMLGAGPQHLFGTTRVINKLRQTLWVPTPPLTRLSASYGWHSNQFEHFHSFLGSPLPQSFSYAREILLFSIPLI